MRKMISLLMVFAFFACEEEQAEKNESNDYVEIEVSTKSQSLIEASNSFGLKAFQRLSQEEDDDNLFISPLSITQALSMTLNGAEGTTETEMIAVLEVSDASDSEYNKLQKDLREALVAADKKTTLSIANSIWYRQNYPVLNEFIDVNKTYFNAEVEELDFAAADAKDIINAWVDDNTNGKIEKIVDRITPSHVMFLINAVYFKGSWANEFDSKNTYERAFHTNASSFQETSFMTGEMECGYYQANDYSAVELPYGNGHFSMVIILPNSHLDDVFISTLDQDKFNSCVDNMVTQKVQVTFPKFKFECDLELNDLLKAMGMPTAFNESADFSGIVNGGGIFISKVKHKTFVEVNEEGTEAAAVTSVEMMETSMPNYTNFMADRPFVFAIREKDTNAIMFIGKFMEPAE